MTLRNIIISICCGFLFSLGWWLLIDGIVQSQSTFLFSFILPAIFCTFAGILLNFVDKDRITEVGEDMFGQGDVGGKVRLWVAIMLTIAFACIGGSIWVLVENYTTTNLKVGQWPGISLLLNTICVFISSVVYFVGRK